MSKHVCVYITITILKLRVIVCLWKYKLFSTREDKERKCVRGCSIRPDNSFSLRSLFPFLNSFRYSSLWVPFSCVLSFPLFLFIYFFTPLFPPPFYLFLSCAFSLFSFFTFSTCLFPFIFLTIFFLCLSFYSPFKLFFFLFPSFLVSFFFFPIPSYYIIDRCRIKVTTFVLYSYRYFCLSICFFIYYSLKDAMSSNS